MQFLWFRHRCLSDLGPFFNPPWRERELCAGNVTLQKKHVWLNESCWSCSAVISPPSFSQSAMGQTSLRRSGRRFPTKLAMVSSICVSKGPTCLFRSHPLSMNLNEIRCQSLWLDGCKAPLYWPNPYIDCGEFAFALVVELSSYTFQLENFSASHAQRCYVHCSKPTSLTVRRSWWSERRCNNVTMLCALDFSGVWLSF